MLTPWKGDRILVDPFCGSGTFPIEAAMMAADIAPGLNRSFLAEQWTHLVPKKCWMDAAEDARYRIRNDIETDIQALISTEMSSRVPERTQSWPVWIT